MKSFFFKKNIKFLSTESVTKHLNSKKRFLIHSFPALSSTQDTLKEMALDNAPEGTVVIAESQSVGRGREGRSFFSPSGSGIYMSLLLRPSVSAPSLPPKKLVFITTSAAVAVSEAIEEITGKSMGIKWVNDIFYGGLKVAGILTEASFNVDNTQYSHIILGIGVNLFKTAFPSELNDIAGSVCDRRPFAASKIKARLIAEILNRFDYYYGLLAKGDYSFIEKYRDRSIVIGKKVDIIVGESTVNSGTVLSLNDDCSLNVKTESGDALTLSFGEVRIKLNEKQ